MSTKEIQVYSDHLDRFQKAQLNSAIEIVNGAQNIFFIKDPVQETQLPATESGRLHPAAAKNFIEETLLGNDHYVICVTSKRMTDDHFAHEDYGYLFLTIADWETQFAPPSLKCYITHIMAGALLSYAANLNEKLVNKYMHQTTRGCLMDYCNNKQDIKLGMYAGYLCGECQNLFQGLGTESSYLAAVDKVLKFVRAEAIGRPIITDWKTVFVVMKYDEDNDIAFREGIKKGLADVGLRAIRADIGNPGGQILDNVREGIRRCQFLIAKVDVLNVNVYLEVGLAMGSDKELLLVAKKNFTNEAPTDLANWHYLTFTEDNYEELRTKIAGYFNSKYHMKYRHAG